MAQNPLLGELALFTQTALEIVGGAVLVQQSSSHRLRLRTSPAPRSNDDDEHVNLSTFLQAAIRLANLWLLRPVFIRSAADRWLISFQHPARAGAIKAS